MYTTMKKGIMIQNERLLTPDEMRKASKKYCGTGDWTWQDREFRGLCEAQDEKSYKAGLRDGRLTVAKLVADTVDNPHDGH